MDDGTELIAQPGDVTSLPSGHDAWVVGDEAGGRRLVRCQQLRQTGLDATDPPKVVEAFGAAWVDHDLERRARHDQQRPGL
jgi:hypothetical protein